MTRTEVAVGELGALAGQPARRLRVAEPDEARLGQRVDRDDRAPRCFASSSAVNIRGWLVPGFCPTMTIRSACVGMSSSVTVPLPMPIVSLSAAPLDSWHMFEQSGRLLVPSRRAKSW